MWASMMLENMVWYWSGFKLILLVGRMVDFLVKKRHVFVTVLKHRQASAPCRRQMETSEKHGEKYGGVFGKARHTFHHVFRLRNKYASTNIATNTTKPSLFWSFGRPPAARGSMRSSKLIP